MTSDRMTAMWCRSHVDLQAQAASPASGTEMQHMRESIRCEFFSHEVNAFVVLM